MNPDLTAPLGAVRSGFILCCICMPKYINGGVTGNKLVVARGE